MIELQAYFGKRPKEPKIKPPKGNPSHIKPPQIENPKQKPHRAPERNPPKK